jgi:hypothetical protein
MQQRYYVSVTHRFVRLEIVTALDRTVNYRNSSGKYSLLCIALPKQRR